MLCSGGRVRPSSVQRGRLRLSMSIFSLHTWRLLLPLWLDVALAGGVGHASTVPQRRPRDVSLLFCSCYMF